MATTANAAARTQQMGDLDFRTELAVRDHDHDGRYAAATDLAAVLARLVALEGRVTMLETPGKKK